MLRAHRVWIACAVVATAVVTGTALRATSAALGSPAIARTTQHAELMDIAGITSSAVSALQAQRTSAPSDNGSAAFPESVNAQLAKLAFRSSTTLVRADIGAPLAAIGNYLTTENSAQKSLAIRSIDILLRAQEQPNGALSNTPTGADIDTMFFAAGLGMAVIALGDRLDAAHRKAWTTAVARAASYLVANKNLSWYTNGNIVVGNTLVEALAAKLTGKAAYADYYRTALKFAVSPPQRRWPGYGFVVTKQPTRSDGADGAGYFTEAGASPGYDGDYTMLQSDQLSRLYLVTRDPAVLRLLNMVTNQLLSKTNVTTWSLNSSNGTRHNYPSEVLDTSAITVLAWQGGRSDLAPYVRSQQQAIIKEFDQVIAQQTPLGDRFFYDLGMMPLSIILAGAASIPTPSVDSAAGVGTSGSLPTAVRIVASRSAVRLKSGITWVPDTAYARGGSYRYNASRVSGTKMPSLFRQGRVEVQSYRIALAPGTYRVSVGALLVPGTVAGNTRFTAVAAGVRRSFVIAGRRARAYRADWLTFETRVGSTPLLLSFTGQRGQLPISAVRAVRISAH